MRVFDGSTCLNECCVATLSGSFRRSAGPGVAPWAGLGVAYPVEQVGIISRSRGLADYPSQQWGQISSAYEHKHDETEPVLAQRIREFASTDRTRLVGLAYLAFQIGQAALSEGYATARPHFLSTIRAYSLGPGLCVSRVYRCALSALTSL
jgi:hypothetical protein